MRSLVSAAEQNDRDLTVSSKIDAISRADVNPQLGHSIANRLGIPEIAGLQPQQANTDTGLGGLVAQSLEPFSKRLAAILSLVPK